MEGFLIHFIPQFRVKHVTKNASRNLVHSDMQRTFQFVFLATFHKQGGIHVRAAGTLTLCTKGIVSPTAVEDATEAGNQGLPASGEQMGRT